MERLLGHLAQFSSLSQQGEVLCTQGLAYLLRDIEAERLFAGWVSLATGRLVNPGLSWQAECRQLDRARPDLEGRNATGQPVIKLEAKLGALFGPGQLESYVSALCAGGHGATFLVVVPKSRQPEAADRVNADFGVAGAGPWRLMRGAAEVSCSVVTWEDLLDALAAVSSERFRDDLGQFRAMYRVFNGDDMAPLTSDAQVLAWRDEADWWEQLVEHLTRALIEQALFVPSGRVPPLGVDGGAQPYRRRYLCRVVSLVSSCYSVGTRDPFQNHQTPIWLRFHEDTGHFVEIAGRLGRSELWKLAVQSQGHLWFPLQAPLNSDRKTMVADLVAQVQRIVEVAYPPAASAEAHPKL